MTYNQHPDPSPPMDIWALLEKSVAANPVQSAPAQQTPQPSEEERARSARTWRRWRRFADLLATIVWLYAFVKIFLFDVDGALIGLAGPSQVGLVEARALILVAFLLVVGIFFWRWKTLALLGYVVAFPAIVGLWKLPRLVYRQRSWLAVMAGLNAAALAARDLRYTLISKSIGVLAAATILLTSASVPLMIAVTYLLLLLAFSSVRAVRRAVAPNWFLRTQQETIENVVKSKFVAQLTTLSDDIKGGKVALLNATQVSSVTTGLSASIVLNRGLYFWAYQLQRYRQAGLSLFFNGLTYAWLFLGAVLTFWLVNLALLKIDPHQFSFAAYPSNIAMLLYALVSFALNDGGGVGSKGDIADLVRIAAGVYGPLFLAVFLLNLLFSWGQQRDSEALSTTVRTLKRRAREQEERVRSDYNVGVDEARRGLERLGQGFSWLIGWLTASIPDEFLGDDEERE